MGLWDGSGTLIASGSHAQTSADPIGWIYVNWASSSPTLSPGQTYTVGYYDPTGSYPFTVGEANSAINNGLSHTVVPGGRFTYGPSLVLPTTTNTASFYADIELNSTTTTLFTSPSTHTGVPPGISLTTVGGFRTTSNGQVIDSQLITGTLYVDHANVVIQNSKFITPGASSWCIDIGTTGAASCTITDCELDAGGSDQGAIRNQSNGSSWTGTRLNIHNGENGVRLGGSATIQDSWIHGFASHQGDVAAHYDCVEIYEGSNSSVLHNFLDLDKTETSCVNVQGDFSTVTNTQIIGNRMRGGGWIVNLRTNPPGTYPVTGITVNNNQFGDSGLGYGAVDATSVTFSGNTDYRTGSNIDTAI
jgi:hypothetical protein